MSLFAYQTTEDQRRAFWFHSLASWAPLGPENTLSSTVPFLFISQPLCLLSPAALNTFLYPFSSGSGAPSSRKSSLLFLDSAQRLVLV